MTDYRTKGTLFMHDKDPHSPLCNAYHVGAEFFGHTMKLHKSINEQITLLKSRGLIIQDENFVAETLSNINYFRLSGYLYQFKLSDDKYEEGLTFERLLDLYTFDSKLTRILMYALENVEETLKTKFSYSLSAAFPEEPLIYLEPKIYKNPDELNKFITLFVKAKTDNSGLPFIKHHNAKYNGNLPIWVAVEIMTIGNVYKLYKNLKTPLQKVIAKEYRTGVVQLTSWIENLTYTRNHLAHYMRIYGYNFGRTPANCAHYLEDSPNGMIFEQIIAMGLMFSDKAEWEKFVVPEMKGLIDKYGNSIELKDLGFPKNWEQVLLSL